MEEEIVQDWTSFSNVIYNKNQTSKVEKWQQEKKVGKQQEHKIEHSY